MLKSIMLPEIFFGLNPKSIELRSVDYERIFNLLGMEHVGNASTCILSISLIQKRAFLYFYYNFRKNISRGHLISKCLFGVFTFFQKMNENKPTVVKSNLFVRFLEEMSAWKNHFNFVWPLYIHGKQVLIPNYFRLTLVIWHYLHTE